MPITSTEIQYRLSGGSANSDPLLSLGGVKSSVAAPAGLFDAVSAGETSAGDTEFRCIYIHNDDATRVLENPVFWIQASGLGGNQVIAAALGTSAVGGTEQTVANENTAPTGVTWDTDMLTKGTGIALGNIPATQHRAVWIRRTVTAGAPASNSTITFRVEGDTLP